MRSSNAFALACAATLTASSAGAQQAAQGFDVERLYTSAPGAGWIVNDALDMRGKLGGAASVAASWARNPLRITDGTQHLAVVSDYALLQLGFAGTYDRYRVYFTFDSPLTVQGDSGTVGAYTFAAPSVDPGSSPDAIMHGRFGFDARLVGDATGAFRLGLGAQIWIPGGAPGSLRSNYLSDGPPSQTLGAYNAQARVLVAGDVGAFVYAGHVGFHLRALDDGTPGSPRGHEALFAAAAGAKISLCACKMALVVGPEIFGASAVRSLFGSEATALEALLSARIEGTADTGPQLRVKLGVGGGLNPHFGAPEQRFVIGVELFDRNAR